MINSDDRILITGCGGMLGEAVYAQFKDKCEVYATDIDINEPWLNYLDVRSAADIKSIFEKLMPTLVINLAALTDLEYCELHQDEAYQTNTWGVHNLVRFFKKADIPFVHISTAGIFDGEKDIYDESDLPNPLSVYGKSKYLGELIALNYGKAIVVRAGWMMGGGPNKDKKFINKIAKQIKGEKRELYIVNDKLGSPCYTYDLAKTMEVLLEKQLFGLYHGVCDGDCSRLELAKYFLSVCGLADKIKIIEVSSDYFKKDFFAPRPFSEKLDNTKLAQLGINFRDWRVCLSEYLEKFSLNL